ncbi:MAG: 23S rRNA (uracil-C(5))-methyltransferase RlmCD [Chlamydiae bacterium]|nr:23S rRNA (uracil-C(5))-methyltransferase RlmCD [Chlamydiota bacterium]
MNNKNFTEEVSTLTSQAQGICSIDGLKIFIDYVLPGERVTAQVTQKKKKYAVAKLLKIETTSQFRAEPVCPLFTRCGGCQIMHMSYALQLDFKTNKVKDALSRIGQIDLKPNPCIASPLELSYRNKIQLPFFNEKNNLKLGLYKKGTNTPIGVDQCYIHCELGEKVFKTLQNLLKDSALKGFDEKTKSGELRHLLIKTGIKTKESLVVFIATSKKCLPQIKDLGEKLVELLPEVKGVVLNINRKRFNTIAGDEYHTLTGRPYIYEKLLGKTFKISAHSFFQVNPSQAEQLYKKAIEFADLKPDQVVLDAYCGIGTLSLLAADHAKEVIGIEVVESAVIDATKNAQDNKISNCNFIQGLVEEKINEIKDLDVVFINPPRKGCEAAVLEALAKRKPQKLIYISCDPATLARDLHYLCQNGFKAKSIQPFDMFPQTTHVETCVLLSPL